MIPATLHAVRPGSSMVVSLYLNLDDNPSGPRLHESMRRVRSRADELDRDATMALRADADAIEALAGRIDRLAVPAVAVFACGPAGLLELVELAQPVWDVVIVARDPYLRPLRAAGEAATTGVAVVDRGRAWVFTVDGGKIEKIAELDDAPLEHPKNPDENLKPNYGGWHGYEERRARGHAEAKADRHFRDAARLLSELNETHRFAHVVVGGHAETLDQFVACLHPSLAGRLAGTFTADPKTLDRAQVRDHAHRLVEEARRQDELATIDRLLDQAGAGERGVLGLAGVLFAANLHAVDHLLVAGSFTKPGNRCTECGWLARNGTRCAACDGPVEMVDDIVGAAVERALADGARVEHVRVASQLDAAGIGAGLRFPIPDGI